MSVRQSSAIGDAANLLYKRLLDESVDGIFVGKITEIYRLLGLPSGYYSYIIGTLKESKSIEYLSRGRQGKPSKIKMGPPPDEVATLDLGLTSAPTAAKLERRMKALEAKYEAQTRGGLNVPEALRNFEFRLAHIEQVLQKLTGG